MSNPAFFGSNLAYALSNPAFFGSNFAYSASNAIFGTSNALFYTSNTVYASSNPAFFGSNFAYSASNAIFGTSNATWTGFAFNGANVTVKGSLSNLGNASLGGTLITSTLSNAGNASIASSLTVGGLVNYGFLSNLGNASIAFASLSALSNSGNTSLAGSVSCTTTLFSATHSNSANVQVGGTLSSATTSNAGNANFGGNVNVGNLLFAASLSNTGNATIVGNVQVNGYVGVGTTTPTYPLHITVPSSTASTSIWVAGDIVSLSDRNVKTDVVPIANALDKVMSIGGYTFAMNDDPTKKRHAGVIAQEIELALEEAVHIDEETGYKSVAYGNLVALLIEAIKELKGEVQRLSK